MTEGEAGAKISTLHRAPAVLLAQPGWRQRVRSTSLECSVSYSQLLLVISTAIHTTCAGINGIMLTVASES